MINQIEKLNYYGKEIILIGTSHISSESIDLVESTINDIQPDAICVELDVDRYQAMENPEDWKKTSIIDVIRNQKIGLLLVNLILNSFQKNIAKKFSMLPGQEMKKGILCAKERKCELILADRNIQITFLRIWRGLSVYEKCKLITGLFLECIESDEITETSLDELMLKDDMLAALAYGIKDFPELTKILIDERNKILAFNIKNAPGEKIVAIIGAAHLLGVKEEIFCEQNLEELNSIPKKSGVDNILKWSIPVFIICLIAYGFINNTETGIRQIASWFIWNSVFTAFFTTILLGHPLTILIASLVAPFTSLNPFLACGWFAGITEASLRKPLVEDFENISNDIFHIRRFLKNRLLRIIAIVIFANIGSTVGTIIAGTNIIKSIL